MLADTYYNEHERVMSQLGEAKFTKFNTAIILFNLKIPTCVCGFNRFCQVTDPDRLTNVIQSTAGSLKILWHQTDRSVSWTQQLLCPQ